MQRCDIQAAPQGAPIAFKGLNPTYPGCSAVILSKDANQSFLQHVLILLTLDAAL